MSEKFQAPIGNVEWKVYTVDQAGHYHPTGAVVVGHTYYEAHRRAAELLGECNLGNVKVEMVTAPNEAETKHDKKVVQSIVNYTVTVNVSYTSKQEIWEAKREKVRLAIENAVNEALDASPYFRDKDQVDYGAAQVTVPPVKRGRRPNNA